MRRVISLIKPFASTWVRPNHPTFYRRIVVRPSTGPGSLAGSYIGVHLALFEISSFITAASTVLWQLQTHGNVYTSDTSSWLPWGATVGSVSLDVHCPPPRRILTTFAVVNIVVTSLSCIFGNRQVLHRLACRQFRRTTHSKLYRFWWAAVVGLQLSANATIGYMFRHTPGYDNSCYYLPSVHGCYGWL